MNDFYNKLAPFYHLIYGDWDAAIEKQATQLSTIIRDRACGHGIPHSPKPGRVTTIPGEPQKA